jgi:hypothetical protein
VISFRPVNTFLKKIGNPQFRQAHRSSGYGEQTLSF